MTKITSMFKLPSVVLSVMLMAMFGFVGIVMAQDDADLGDNEVCLECHEGTEWSAPENSDRPRIHEDSGQFIQEDHEMWSCTDCHTDILEIPHHEGVERDVNCTNCHETTPEK